MVAKTPRLDDQRYRFLMETVFQIILGRVTPPALMRPNIHRRLAVTRDWIHDAAGATSAAVFRHRRHRQVWLPLFGLFNVPLCCFRNRFTGELQRTPRRTGVLPLPLYLSHSTTAARIAKDPIQNYHCSLP